MVPVSAKLAAILETGACFRKIDCLARQNSCMNFPLVCVFDLVLMRFGQNPLVASHMGALAARRIRPIRMKKPIRLNAFAMNCVGNSRRECGPTRATAPRNITAAVLIDLAKTLERGGSTTVSRRRARRLCVFGGSPDAALRNARRRRATIPAADPGDGTVTEHLGFGGNSNLSYEPPYTFARRMSTLDHLTEGRVGWNVVTGYLDSAAKAAGKEKQTGHDDRYEVADEYMEVVYKLWEGSWEDDAVLRDRARGIFTDPAKVHRVQHAGANYRVDAIHLCEPSPQRTPVLYQAGTSPRGGSSRRSMPE